MIDINKLFTEYVEGEIDVEKFEQILYKNVNQIEKELTDLDEFNLYLQLIETNYAYYGPQLNVQDYLTRYLAKNNIKFKKSNKYSENYCLLLDVFPRWIDTSQEGEKYLKNELLPKLPPNLSKQETKHWLNEQIKKWYVYAKIPKWLQSANWPFSHGKPMMFMGQINLKDGFCFHDTTYLYIFLCQISGEYKIIKQSC